MLDQLPLDSIVQYLRKNVKTEWSATEAKRVEYFRGTAVLRCLNAFFCTANFLGGGNEGRCVDPMLRFGCLPAWTTLHQYRASSKTLFTWAGLAGVKCLMRSDKWNIKKKREASYILAKYAVDRACKSPFLSMAAHSSPLAVCIVAVYLLILPSSSARKPLFRRIYAPSLAVRYG